MANSAVEPGDLLARAAELDRQARSEEALQVLEGCGVWPVPYNERGLLLRASIFTLTRDPIMALDELPDDGAFTGADERVELLLTSARAYMLARNWSVAEDLLNRAAAALGDRDTPNRYLLAHIRARLRWNLRRYDAHDPDLATAIQAPNASVRLSALNLRAWMHCGLEDYRAQLADFRSCLDIYEREPGACRLLTVAQTLQSMLGLSWEMCDNESARRAQAGFEALPWTPDLQMYRFLCIRGLGWQAFVDGDALQAETMFQLALQSAPSIAWAALSHSDRACAAQLSGDESLAHAEVSRAQAVAAKIDWRAQRYEERASLLTLAVVLAPFNAGEARGLLAKYQGLYPHGLSVTIEASHEPSRLRAHQSYAEGRVQQFMGNAAVAARLLSDAYRILVQIGHPFRAALAAKALYEITDEVSWLSAARTHAAAFPNCVVAQNL